jgi:hypothetical protein
MVGKIYLKKGSLVLIQTYPHFDTLYPISGIFYEFIIVGKKIVPYSILDDFGKFWMILVNFG